MSFSSGSKHFLLHLILAAGAPKRYKQANKQVDIQDGPWIKNEDSSILQPSPPENRLESALKNGKR